MTGPREDIRMSKETTDQERKREHQKEQGTDDIDRALDGQCALSRERRRETVEREGEELLDVRVGVGGPIEVDEHARVDAEVLAGLQGIGEPVEAVGRDREEDLVHDHVFLQQVGKVLRGSR